MDSLAGPTPMNSIGTPRNFSMYSTYDLQLAGRSSYLVMDEMSVSHPGRVTYLTSTLASRSRSAGTDKGRGG